MDPVLEILTIGAFGCTEREFYAALAAARVDVLVDIRQRRGVRGATYAFVNSARLQRSLAEHGIGYVYATQLAPTDAVRDLQRRADARAGIGIHHRTKLDPDFAAVYRAQILGALEPRDVLDLLPPGCTRPALFCVEEHPRACHRSLAAEWLAGGLGVPTRAIDVGASPP